MIEEIFYLDEGHVKITAASVGISSKRWTCINSDLITEDNYKALMKDNRFDILPIVADQSTREFFRTKKPNIFDNIIREPITHNDVLPLDTSIREVIKSLVTENRTFYFLTYQNHITGLITLGNLNCRQVQVYIFGIICELERILSEFIDDNLSRLQLENFMKLKAKTNEKMKKTWEHYQVLVQLDLENKLIEHLFLVDFFNIIEHFELYRKLSYSKQHWKDLTSINDLRNLVAHPTRSLLDKDNDINRLLKRIEKIEDLTFRLIQIRPLKKV
jgi:hypothetical protein